MWMQPTKSMNKTFLHFLALLFVTTSLSAQFDFGEPAETENITFQVKASKAEAAAGSSLEVSVTARMDDGWHIYGFKEYEGSVATVIALDAGQPFKLGDVTSPRPKHVKKKFGETDLEYDSFEGEVTFTLPITISEDAPAGEATLKGSVKYQICSDKICLLPKTYAFSLPLRITEASGADEETNPLGAFPAQGDGAEKEKQPAEEAGPDGRVRSSKLSYRIEPAAKSVRAGDAFELRVEVKLDAGWHVYGIDRSGVGIKTAVELEDGSFSLAGPLASDQKPKTAAATEFTPAYDYYEGNVLFTQRIQAAAGTKPGTQKLRGTFHFQECNDNSCLRPSKRDFAFDIEVLPASDAALPSPATDKPETQKTEGSKDVAKVGFIAFLGLAFGAGLLTLITPCVFPLIPVTISYFLKQSQDSGSSPFNLSLCYGAGIIGSFTGLGFILTVFFSANAARQFAANPIVNLIIGILFVVFAFSLLGAFDLRLPASLQQKLNFMGKGGYAGALFLGLTFAVTAFACTAPFASAVLLAASQGDYFWSILGMLAYSGTMAVPFFILGLFPSLMKNLPKSGGWMNAVKVSFGFFELAAAFKFFSNVDWQMGWGILPRSIVLSTWVICSAFVCLYLLHLFRLPHDTPQDSISVTRVTFALITGALALWMATGLGGKPLGYLEAFLPPEQFSTDAPKEVKQWQKDVSFEEGRKSAREQGKPLVLEFTGFT